MIVPQGPGSLPQFEQAVRSAAIQTAQRLDRVVQRFADRLFAEITEGGRYSPGTPVGPTGRTRRAWRRDREGSTYVFRHPHFHAVLLEAGSSSQAPHGFLRLAVAAAPLLLAEVSEQILAESA